MATSRYVTGGSASNTDSRQSVSSTSGSIANQSGTTTSNSSNTTNTDQTQTTNQTTRNMSPQAEAALNALIRQLQNGGTPEMQRQAAERQRVLAETRANQSQYSKAAAFGDAQGLVSQQMRRALESLLPSINRAAEGAGSSGGALRALLLQDAANKASESSAALGVQTAVNYGNINTNFAQVMEALSRQDPKATEMLINALNTAKGATQVTNGTTRTTGTQTQTGTNQVIGNQTTTNAGFENKNLTTDFTPFNVTADTTPQFFGALHQPFFSTAGTSRDNREQLAGLLDPNPWQNYQL